jgi:single-stranded DNA-binding protein
MAIECALFGSLGRDAEQKTSKAGKPFMRLNVRTGDGDGAQWISCTVFDEQAIDNADKLVKGARVYIEGRLSLDEWSASDGTKKRGLSCMSWHCRLSQIGRNRPKRDEPERAAAAARQRAAVKKSPPMVDSDLNDEIPW